jgi:hypothetical protein
VVEEVALATVAKPPPDAAALLVVRGYGSCQLHGYGPLLVAVASRVAGRHLVEIFTFTVLDRSNTCSIDCRHDLTSREWR